MSVFDERNLTVEERTKLKNVIDSTITAMEEIKDLTDSMNDDIKSRCEALNEGYADKDLWIKPALIKKMAKSKMKNKEDIEKSKTALDEVETGLHLVYNL